MEDQDIYPFQFIAVASHAYKNWLQFEQHYTPLSWINFGKCPDKYSNLISTPLIGCQSWWASTLRATRPRHHNLCAFPLVCCKTIDPYSTTLSKSQESYLTTGMLPYKHSTSFFPPTHSSIMLPPCQPRIFARLSRWQLSNFVNNRNFSKTSASGYDIKVWRT